LVFRVFRGGGAVRNIVPSTKSPIKSGKKQRDKENVENNETGRAQKNLKEMKGNKTGNHFGEQL